MLDPVLFVATFAIALGVFIFATRVSKRLVGMKMYQEEIRRHLNIYAVITTIVFVLWFLGWYLQDGPMFGYGVLLFVVFAIISVAFVGKARSLDQYAPGKRTAQRG